MSWYCREQKYGNNGDEDDLVLCSLTMENKKENVKKKSRFAEGVKQHSEAGMM